MAISLLDQAYENAKKVLHNCVHTYGFKASALVKGYPHVWARDSMITSFGALLTNDATRYIMFLKETQQYLLKTKFSGFRKETLFFWKKANGSMWRQKVSKWLFLRLLLGFLNNTKKK